MFGKCRSRQSTCEKIWCWTMVIYWTRFWKEVVFWRREKPTRSLGSYRGRNAVGIRRKRTSYFPCNDSIVQGSTQEQRTWKTVDTLRCRWTNNWNNSVNQFSIYGAVAAFCEEFEDHQDGSGEPEISMGQSIILGEIKAEVLCRMKILWIIKFYGNST